MKVILMIVSFIALISGALGLVLVGEVSIYEATMGIITGIIAGLITSAFTSYYLQWIKPPKDALVSSKICRDVDGTYKIKIANPNKKIALMDIKYTMECLNINGNAVHAVRTIEPRHYQLPSLPAYNKGDIRQMPTAQISYPIDDDYTPTPANSLLLRFTFIASYNNVYSGTMGRMLVIREYSAADIINGGFEKGMSTKVSPYSSELANKKRGRE